MPANVRHLISARRPSLPSAPAAGLAVAAVVLAGLLAGCESGQDETVTIQQGNTIITLPAQRTLRPINLAEGQQIAADLAEGKKDPAKLTTEEQRQLAALVAATKKKKRD
jgi:hypothetical protein